MMCASPLPSEMSAKGDLSIWGYTYLKDASYETFPCSRFETQTAADAYCVNKKGYSIALGDSSQNEGLCKCQSVSNQLLLGAEQMMISMSHEWQVTPNFEDKSK